MALPALIKDLNEVPEAVQKEYVKGENENEGKYVLDVVVTEGMRLANVDKLMNALNSERTKAKDLETKFKDFEGIDPSDIRKKIEELDKLKAEGTSDEKTARKLEAIRRDLEREHESAKKQLIDKYSGETKARDERISKLQAKLNETLVTDKLRNALVKAGCISPDLMLPHVSKAVALDLDEDLNSKITVRDNENNTRLSLKSGSTEPMSIEEYASTLKDNEDYKILFKGSGAQGMPSGGRPVQGQGARGSSDLSELSPQERLRRYRETNSTE